MSAALPVAIGAVGGGVTGRLIGGYATPLHSFLTAGGVLNILGEAENGFAAGMLTYLAYQRLRKPSTPINATSQMVDIGFAGLSGMVAYHLMAP